MGMSAPTSNPTDYFSTPVGLKVPGIDIHAQTINYLLAAALDEQALLKSMPAGVDWVWIAGWALLGCGLTVKQRAWIMWLLSLGIATLALYGISYGLFTMGLWVPLVPGALALLGASGGAAALPQAQTMLKTR